MTHSNVLLLLHMMSASGKIRMHIGILDNSLTCTQASLITVCVSCIGSKIASSHQAVRPCSSKALSTRNMHKLSQAMDERQDDRRRCQLMHGTQALYVLLCKQINLYYWPIVCHCMSIECKSAESCQWLVGQSTCEVNKTCAGSLCSKLAGHGVEGSAHTSHWMSQTRQVNSTRYSWSLTTFAFEMVCQLRITWSSSALLHCKSLMPSHDYVMFSQYNDLTAYHVGLTTDMTSHLCNVGVCIITVLHACCS